MTSDDVQALNEHNAQNGDDEDEDEAEDDEDDEDEDGEADWTVRIAAGQALATAAEGFEGALLEILLPNVNQMLSSGDWFQREAAVHALGSVAQGCGEAMNEHLHSLIPFLLQSLSDPNVSPLGPWSVVLVHGPRLTTGRFVAANPSCCCLDDRGILILGGGRRKQLSLASHSGSE